LDRSSGLQAHHPCRWIACALDQNNVAAGRVDDQAAMLGAST
jgi:hypothetical protein